MGDRFNAARYVAEETVRRLGAERTRLRAELNMVTDDLEIAVRHLTTQYGHSTRQTSNLAGVSHETIAIWVRRP